MAELEWQEWVVARRRVDAVLAPGADAAGTEVASDLRDADVPSAPGDAVKPRSRVPVWREGLARSASFVCCGSGPLLVVAYAASLSIFM